MIIGSAKGLIDANDFAIDALGVGTSLMPINTKINTLTGMIGKNGIHINQDGQLHLNTLTSSGVVSIVSNTQLLIDDLMDAYEIILNAQDIIMDADMNAAQSITLLAQSDIVQNSDIQSQNSQISAYALGSILMAEGTLSQALNGDIAYQAYDNLAVSLLIAKDGTVSLEVSPTGVIEDSNMDDSVNVIANHLTFTGNALDYSGSLNKDAIANAKLKAIEVSVNSIDMNIFDDKRNKLVMDEGAQSDTTLINYGHDGWSILIVDTLKVFDFKNQDGWNPFVVTMNHIDFSDKEDTIDIYSFTEEGNQNDINRELNKLFKEIIEELFDDKLEYHDFYEQMNIIPAARAPIFDLLSFEDDEHFVIKDYDYWIENIAI